VKRFASARPYNFPYDGSLSPESTALLCIDMQRDFLDEGGYVHTMGYDLAPLRRTIAPSKTVLDAARQYNYLIIHTRGGRRRDMSEVAPVKRFRSELGGAEFGAEGPLGRFLVRGEAGHEIVAELSPLPGEPVLDKPSSSAFYGTELELILSSRRIRNLVLLGLTTDVCVHSSLRSAIDRGFDCLLLEDCTAATVHSNYLAAISTITMEGGYFGAVTTSEAFTRAVREPASP
jgi:nicotinamidase-related amidase